MKLNKFDLKLIDIINTYISTKILLYLDTQEVIDFIFNENYDLWSRSHQQFILNYVQNQINIYYFIKLLSK